MHFSKTNREFVFIQKNSFKLDSFTSKVASRTFNFVLNFVVILSSVLNAYFSFFLNNLINKLSFFNPINFSPYLLYYNLEIQSRIFSILILFVFVKYFIKFTVYKKTDCTITETKVKAKMKLRSDLHSNSYCIARRI
jgi:hypothetical protein